MTARITILFLLVVFAQGCTDGADDPAPETEILCRPTQSVCLADTICGQSGCEPAFDRTYRVRVSALRAPAKRDGECPDDRSCVAPRAIVYFSELDEPILRAPGSPSVAEIVVTEGSSLVVDVRSGDCAVALTPADLRSGEVECRDGSVFASLSLTALPF